MMSLLDVAVGPMYVIFGLVIIIIVAVVAILVYFSVKTIIRIKQNRE